jgi:hypothetical protein
MAFRVAVARPMTQDIGSTACDGIQFEVPTVPDGVADELETLPGQSFFGRAPSSELGRGLRDVSLLPIDVFARCEVRIEAVRGGGGTAAMDRGRRRSSASVRRSDVPSTTRAIGAPRNCRHFSRVCPNYFGCACEIGNLFRRF